MKGLKMSIKTFIKAKIAQTIQEFALSAVIYAEDFLGGQVGPIKKELAIYFILSKLPVYLVPFKSIIKRLLSDSLDWAIEKAVKKLHEIQEKTGILAS